MTAMQNAAEFLKDRLSESVKKRLKQTLPTEITRHFVAGDDVVAIVSYPKCGRTWLRLLISHAAYRSFPPVSNEVDYLSLNRLKECHPKFPRMYVTHEDWPMYKTPEELETNKRHYFDRKVVFLVRDPRDVVVSWYFQVTKRGSLKHFNEFIEMGGVGDFVYNKRGGLNTIISYYNIWWKSRCVPEDFLLLRYEDLHKRPVESLENLFQFVNCKSLIDQEAIKFSIEKNRFENVKRAEEEGAFEGQRPFKAVDSKDPNARKARRGEVGGYVDYIEEKDIKHMNECIAESLNPAFGY